MTTTDDQVIDALNLLDGRKAQMPKQCPRWCVGQHVQAIEEGCDVEQARVHRTYDYAGGHLPTNYRVEMERDSPHPNHWGPTIITIEVMERKVGDDGNTTYSPTHLPLTTAEARSLAAALVHLANEGELHP